MGFRYRRSKKVLPGVKVNVSKSGVSWTFGGKHARTTVGHGRITNSVRTPIKGLSYSKTTRTGSSRQRLNSSSKSNASSKAGAGCVGGLAALFALVGVFAIGVIVIYVAIMIVLLWIAFTYYKANSSLSPDQVERLASILYENEPDKNYSAWKVYRDKNSELKFLGDKIHSLEGSVSAYNSDDPKGLIDLLETRETEWWKEQMLKEIDAEPDFYDPGQDDFYENSFKKYLNNTFSQVVKDASSLKTERGRKNRYILYFEKYRPFYEQLPEAARYELDNVMKEHEISFLADEQI